VTAVSAVAAAVVAGSSFPHLQIVPCEFKPPYPPEARQGPIGQKGAHDKILGKTQLRQFDCCLTCFLVCSGCDCAWFMLDLQGSICPHRRTIGRGAVALRVETVVFVVG
jgi:hypothetical protein